MRESISEQACKRMDKQDRIEERKIIKRKRDRQTEKNCIKNQVVEIKKMCFLLLLETNKSREETKEKHKKKK